MSKSNHCAYVNKGVRLKLIDSNDGVYAIVQPCCHMTGGFISSDVRGPYKVNSAEDILNHKTLIYFREYFKNNDDLPKECVACINHEKKGLESPRIRMNNQDIVDFLNFKEYDINVLDVVLGNSCNLACPFCSSYASSLIDKLSRKLSEDERPVSWNPIGNFAKGSNKTSDVVADILSKYKVRTLKLIGGEPLLKENWNRISDLIDTGVCKDMHLEITTNGTILNDEIFERMSKTESAHLRISVDSIGKNYEFIRWPHSWDKMHKNLDYLRNNKYENIHVSVSNLVNIFNFEFLPEIEDYFKDVKAVVGYNIELKPDTHLMSYHNLPEHIIENIRSKVKKDDLRKGLVKGNNNYTKEQIKREFEVLLAQRNMKAVDVIGPMTREWLDL